MKKQTKYGRKMLHRAKTMSRVYTLWDELKASPHEPFLWAEKDSHLSVMWQGFFNIEKGENPGIEDWRNCSDAVNFMETYLEKGPWLDCNGRQVEFKDENGLLNAAVEALAKAGTRSLTGKHIRLDGLGLEAVRSILNTYEEVLSVLPKREAIRAYRATDKRIREIQMGKKSPHDVKVVAI